MKNLFKTFKVVTPTVIAFDTYKENAYISKSLTAALQEGRKIVGSVTQKGDKKVLIIDPEEQEFDIVDSKGNEVESLLEIPIENVKWVFPWWLLIVGIIVIGGGIFGYKYFKK